MKMSAVVCFAVLAVVCFTTTESVGTRMRREHVEWWNALLEDFQQQVSQAMTSVVESCDQTHVQLVGDTNLTQLLLEMIQETASENSCWKQLHQEKIIQSKQLGENCRYPAFSCEEIAERKPNSSSGFYWLENCANSPPLKVYCELEKSFSTLQKMIVEITINWLPQFRKSIVFETELTKKMFILTIIFYSVQAPRDG